MNNLATDYMNDAIDRADKISGVISGTPKKPDYHSQEGAKTPRLTYSIAKILLNKSPLHAWHRHPLLGNTSMKPTKAMDIGSIGHDLLLGGGDPIDVLDYDSFRTKLAQEEKAQSYASGHIPVLRKDYEKIEFIVGKVNEQLLIYCPEFFTSHENEFPVIWKAENGVECQSKYDWISSKTGLMIDLKFTTDSSPDKCVKKIIDMGYDVQEAFYTEAFNKTYPDMAGRTNWKFIFIETEEPHAISIIETDSTFKELGRMKMNYALDAWKACLESNIWLGYGKTTVEAPGWAVYKMGEK